jgi:hypothetical protein
VLVQPDDRIVLIGTDQEPPDHLDFVTIRLNSDGSLDTTFGGAAAASASTSTETAIAPAPASGDSSISALDAASIQQLLAEPEANNTWTRKSRFKLLAL